MFRWKNMALIIDLSSRKKNILISNNLYGQINPIGKLLFNMEWEKSHCQFW